MYCATLKVQRYVEPILEHGLFSTVDFFVLKQNSCPQKYILLSVILLKTKDLLSLVFVERIRYPDHHYSDHWYHGV